MKANAAERKIVEDAMTLPAELVALITRPRPEDEAGPPHWSHVDRGELERFLSILGGKAVAEGASPGAGRSSKSINDAEKKSTEQGYSRAEPGALPQGEGTPASGARTPSVGSCG